jgi:O-antigen biosynthesis protein
MQELSVATKKDPPSKPGEPGDLPFTGERLVTAVANEIMMEHLHRYGLAIDLCDGKVVLDIASGEGYGSSLLARRALRVYGVDISSEAVEHASKKYQAPNLKFLQGRADAIPVADHEIELAVSFEHHDLHDEMMRELRRVLQADGLLIISTPDKRYYSEEPKITNEYHVKELYEAEFHDLLERHFRNVRVMHQRILHASVIDAQAGDCGITLYEGDYGNISKIRRIEKAPYLVALASDGNLPPMNTSLFDGTALLHGLFLELHRREVEVVYKEAELQKLHNFLPIYLYRAIRDPVKKLLGLPARSTAPSTKRQERGDQANGR